MREVHGRYCGDCLLKLCLPQIGSGKVQSLLLSSLFMPMPLTTNYVHTMIVLHEKSLPAYGAAQTFNMVVMWL